jgi:hypothetical protein
VIATGLAGPERQRTNSQDHSPEKVSPALVCSHCAAAGALTVVVTGENEFRNSGGQVHGGS